METIWFVLVALMLAAYVVLDGFDIGAGILHLLIADEESDRQIVLRTIGPVWDGNEVWLIAGGGTLYFAFPLLYASAFSGFYLPLTIVLWLLILRGIGIEFRMHIASTVWRGLFDGCFALASLLLAVFYGAALANVLRGVPLQPDGYFFEPLWTNWRVGPQPGILDWYTVIGAITAVVALAVHGATYVALKTEGELNGRARSLALRLWPALALLTVVSLASTIYVRPGLLANYRGHPAIVVIPLTVLLALAALPVAVQRRRERGAFASSSAFLVAMCAGAAAALYPSLLPSSSNSDLNLTIFNAAAGRHALTIGLVWWSGGMLLAAGYVVFVYRMFRGKVSTVISA
ncbi:MAG: cytochrome d ubiquinol oxidase subunit II [Acidobacteriota bacterium]